MIIQSLLSQSYRYLQNNTITNTGEKLIIQTLHPHISCDDRPYIDGWRKGSWEGFSKEFVAPPPWYLRTPGSWAELYTNNGLQLTMLKEPTNPQTGEVASLLMVGSIAKWQAKPQGFGTAVIF